MSLFGKSTKNKKSKVFEYIVHPPKELKLRHKKFKTKKASTRFAMKLGPGSMVIKTVDTRGSWYSRVGEWIVDYDFRYYGLTGNIKFKLYKLSNGFRKTSKIDKESKIWSQFSYKVFCKMCSYPNCNVGNLIILWRKQGIPLDNPDEDMRSYTSSCLTEMKSLDDVEWSYWSDRCNYSRAFVIYTLYNKQKTGTLKHLKRHKFV